MADPYGSGWLLLRMSLHEPLLVLQVENDQLGMNRKVLASLQPFFEDYELLDLQALSEAVEE